MPASSALIKTSALASLADDLYRFRHDPLGYVMYAFPWGTPRLPEKRPYDWQIEVLQYLGEQLVLGTITATEAIQIARASGHGIGKSALVAWLIKWAMDTAVDTRGVVTANTDNQLKQKTWPELGKWHHLSITAPWFEFTASALFSTDPEHEKNWRIDCVPWSENNTEAFAGLHNQGKRILLIFDEASAISDKIWEVAEGALTDEDTEIIWCAFGNPTRNQGRFFDCFNKLKHRWHTGQIDSRTVPGTNSRQIQKWIDDYGEDSDFVKVRVRGLFPSASAFQLIELDHIQGAMTREMNYTRPNVAVIGVDVARFGDDDSVIRVRCGRDGRYPKWKCNGARTNSIVAAVVERVNMFRQFKMRVVIMVDGTGGYGAGVVDALRGLGYEVIEVMFGAAADNPKKYFNKRTEMYYRLREWLKVGHLDQDDDLQTQLTAIMYTFHRGRDVPMLQPKEVMKDDLGYSPDDADALALTFAYPVEELPPDHPLRKDTAGVTPANNRRNYNPHAEVRR